ncbi:dihydrofolate reductase [Candidatus Kaiserbacteria bacterium]|nr:dihydrofolate reductase [Candidatus Kaiserbacteria bacterium]
MYSPRISAVAAIGRRRELGKNNRLIWRISDDLKRVKELTTGHTIVMGRKNFESIGRPLPHRTNIVISGNPGFKADGIILSTSLKEALERAREVERDEIFIFGGGRVYEEALPFIERLYLTVIEAEDEGADTFFPPFEDVFTKKTAEERRFDKKTGLYYSWVTLEKTTLEERATVRS